MPFRPASLLLLSALLAGCMAQRDAADMEAESPTPADTMSASDDVVPPAPGGAPNIAVYLDGTWEITLTPENGASIQGELVLQDGGANRFVGLFNDAGIEVRDRYVTGNTFYLSGVADTASGPLPFEASGTLNGDAMEGSVLIEGMGPHALMGSRNAD